jgi:hypothetical protein
MTAPRPGKVPQWNSCRINEQRFSLLTTTRHNAQCTPDLVDRVRLYAVKSRPRRRHHRARHIPVVRSSQRRGVDDCLRDSLGRSRARPDPAPRGGFLSGRPDQLPAVTSDPAIPYRSHTVSVNRPSWCRKLHPGRFSPGIAILRACRRTRRPPSCQSLHRCLTRCRTIRTARSRRLGSCRRRLPPRERQ